MVIASRQSAASACARSPAGARCTWFLAPFRSRRRAQALDRRHARAEGRRHHRRGRGRGARRAARACCRPACTKVEGSFERGDAVVIRNGDGAELGRGLAAYDHDGSRRIIGRKSSEIAGDSRLPWRPGADPPRRHGAARGGVEERDVGCCAGQPQASIEPMMLYMGRQAREAARDAGARLDGAEERGARGHGRALRSADRRDPRSQQATISTPRAAKAATRPSSTGWR